MKHLHSPRGGRPILGLLASCLAIGSALAADIPTGKLNVDRTLVRVGTRSQLDWQIQYPAAVAPPKLNPDTNLRMRTRVLGVGFQKVKSNNGHGNNIDGVDVSNPSRGSGGPNGTIDRSGSTDDEMKADRSLEMPVELMWSRNGSSWSRLFYGTGSSVNPTSIVLETSVKKGDKINFSGRAYSNSWLPLYSTAATTSNVVQLTNGARLPAVCQGRVLNFLKPYLAGDGSTIVIGRHDILILMELGETKPSNSGFDLQDLAVLVTFE